MDATALEAVVGQEEVSEKALEKRKIGEWRKTVKQLRAKDAQNKLAAIAKCDENNECLVKGECLAPLLHLCVPSKKNTEDIVAAAMGAVVNFLEATAIGDDASHNNARAIFEATDKKANKLPGGRLYTDLLRHECIDVVHLALRAYGYLVLALKSPSARVKKSFALQMRAGNPITAVAEVLKRYSPPQERDREREQEKQADEEGEEKEEEDDASAAKKVEILATSLSALDYLLEVREGTASPDACASLVHADAVGALVVCSSAFGEYNVLVPPSLQLLAATTADNKSGVAKALVTERVASQSLLDQILRLTKDVVIERGGLKTELLHCVSVLEQLLVTSAAVDNSQVPCGETATALTNALQYCLEVAEQGGEIHALLAVTARCFQRLVEAFGGEACAAVTPSAQTKLLKLLVLPDGTPRLRFTLEKALHCLAHHDGQLLVLEDEFMEKLVAAMKLEADFDARVRAIRFAETLASKNAKTLGVSVVEPLLAVVAVWTTSAETAIADDDLFAVNAGIGAAIACRVLLRVVTAAPATRAAVAREGALETLDTAFAKTVGDSAFVRVWDPARVDWSAVASEGSTTAYTDVAARALIADLLAFLAVEPHRKNEDEAPADENIERAVVTAQTAETALALAESDLDYESDAPYWGRRRALMRDDLHHSTMNLLAALATTEKGRASLLTAAASWTPPSFQGDDANIDANDSFEAPHDVADPSARQWWPYVHVLALPLSVLFHPTALVSQCEAAVFAVRALTRDLSREASLQPLDVDRFAGTTIGLGGLVALAALSSEETVRNWCPDASSGVDSLVSSAQSLSFELIERAAMRVARLNARAAAAGALAFSISLEESRAKQAHADQDAALAAEQIKADKKKAAKKKGQQQQQQTEEVPDSRPISEAELAEREAQMSWEATMAATHAADGARLDERGGPTHEQWVTILSSATDDRRRRHGASTPLLAALAGRCSSVVRALLEAGVDVDVADGARTAPLARALTRGSLAEGVALLGKGADVDVLDSAGAPILEYAFVAPSADAVSIALAAHDEETKLEGNAEFVATLLSAGADPNVANGTTGKFPLHWAIEGVSMEVLIDGLMHCTLTMIRSRSEQLVALLVERGGRVDCCDRDGTTPLHSALWRGDVTLALALLEAGAQPNLSDMRRRLPLHIACSRLGDAGMLEVVERLLVEGCHSPRGEARFDNARAGRTSVEKTRLTVSGILDDAFRNAVLPPVVVNRLPSSGELIAATDTEGRTPVHCAAGADYDQRVPNLDRRAEAVAELLARDDVTFDLLIKPCDAKFGAGVVHLSVERMGDAAIPVLERAFQKGAPLDELIVCPPVETAICLPTFDVGTRCGVLAPTGSLETPARTSGPASAPAPAPSGGSCEGEAPVPSSRRILAPLHLAILANASHVVRWLLERGAHPPAYAAPSPLSLAALVGASADVTRLLLANGSTVGLEAELGGMSVLHVAAALGHESTLRALVKDGVDIHDINNRTPLLLATLARRLGTMRLLLDSGADVSLRDCNGMSVLDVAIELRSSELLRHILAAPQTTPIEADLLHAERVHVELARAVYTLEKSKRPCSSHIQALQDATDVLRILQATCSIPDDHHVESCFASGALYSDILEAQEQAEIRHREQEAAARSIQIAVRQRNERNSKKKMRSKKRPGRKRKAK